MNENSILFNAEMVLATLDGRKTQTRRVVKFKDKINPGMVSDDGWPIYHDDFGDEVKQPCPYGAVGDELWVRETWTPDLDGIAYRADGGDITNACYPFVKRDVPTRLLERAYDRQAEKEKEKSHWSPSIFMPRWASRIQLRITGVRVERVQEITEDDAQAEGIGDHEPYCTMPCELDGYPACNCGDTSYIESFEQLWDSINEKRGYGLDKNPHVWVIEFEVVK